MISIGKKLMLVDIVLSYIIPAMLVIVIGVRRDSDYLIYEVGVLFWVTILWVVLFFILWAVLFRPFELRLRGRKRTFKDGVRLLDGGVVFPAIFLAVALVYFADGLNRNRYDSIAASDDSLVILVVVIFYKAVISFQALYLLIDNRRMAIFYKSWYWPIMCAGLLLTIDGSMSALLFLVVVQITLLPGLISSLVYKGNARSSDIIARPVLLLAALLLITLVWMFGEAVKRGSIEDAIIAFSSRENISHMLYWLVDRVSTLFYSLNVYLNNSISRADISYDAFTIITDNLKYRFCVLFSDMCDIIPQKNHYSQVSHMNYFMISPETHLTKAGASPGIITSALYLFPTVLAPVMASLYYYLISLIVDYGVIVSHQKLSFIGCMIGVFLLRGVLLNPADMLIVFGYDLIYFAIFIGVSVFSHGQALRIAAGGFLNLAYSRRNAARSI